MNVLFGRRQLSCFFVIAQRRVPKLDVFYIIRCSECARPRAVKKLEVEFATKHKNPKDWRVYKYTAFKRYKKSRCVNERALKVYDAQTSPVR